MQFSTNSALHKVSKVLLVMKLISCLLLVSFMEVSAGAYSQGDISIKKENVSLNQLIESVESQCEYRFFYNSQLNKEIGKINMNVSELTITDFLNELSTLYNLEYSIKDSIVVLKPKPAPRLKSDLRSDISGMVKDAKTDEPLIGASVKVKGTTTGTVTDVEGNFTLSLDPGKYTLQISFVGYETSEKRIEVNPGEDLNLNITLEESLQSLMDVVVVVGSRTVPRTTLDSPVPIDNVSSEQLESSGQGVLDQQLMFRVPSYNSTQQPISDAAAHFSPADLRGLFPSRTLVLVNGKRKNSSALVYSYVTPGRGEVGVDMKSIPTAAIERVEILRDGAAAQYGSDAVAGVINLVLKKKTDPFVNTGYSVTSEGDGAQYSFDTGFGVNITDKGYANFTFSYFDQSRSQRAGTITSLDDEASYWGVTPTSSYSLSDLDGFLDRNPSAGFQVGLPDMTITSFAFNSGYTLQEETDTELYTFGTMTNRSGSAPQFARVPYWVPGFQAIYPNQEFFLAEMAPEIRDHTFTLGLRSTYNDWDFDISSTLGKNRIDYYIVNSFNQSFAGASPSNFYNGAHEFSHVVNNINISRVFEPTGLKALSLAFGAEHRTENFVTEAGEFASYGDGESPDAQGDRTGSESFPGFTPENASNNYRNNLGIYSELSADFTENFLVGGALRYENYSDFGENISWKVESRLKFGNASIRGSVSNGFRAPALHQIYYTAVTTTLTQNGVVQNGILNNQNPALRALGIPELQPEKSLNLGAGLTYRFNENIGLTADFYNIAIEDRVVLSGQVTATGDANSPIDQVLNNVGVGSAGFFLNAVETNTQGVDIVLSFDNINLGKGVINGNLSANFNKTTVEDVTLPQFIVNNDLESNILSREDISRLETWRPREKVIGTITYTLDKFSTTLSNMYYGSVTYLSNNEIDDATYGGKVLTDLSVSYEFTDKIKLTVGSNNLFDVYPDTFAEAYADREGHPTNRNLDFVGRFQYPWQTTQFGIDGRRYFVNAAIKF